MKEPRPHLLPIRQEADNWERPVQNAAILQRKGPTEVGRILQKFGPNWRRKHAMKWCTLCSRFEKMDSRSKKLRLT